MNGKASGSPLTFLRSQRFAKDNKEDETFENDRLAGAKFGYRPYTQTSVYD